MNSTVARYSTNLLANQLGQNNLGYGSSTLNRETSQANKSTAVRSMITSTSFGSATESWLLTVQCTIQMLQLPYFTINLQLNTKHNTSQLNRCHARRHCFSKYFNLVTEIVNIHQIGGMVTAKDRQTHHNSNK
jgi:hypothetical protein